MTQHRVRRSKECTAHSPHSAVVYIKDEIYIYILCLYKNLYKLFPKTLLKLICLGFSKGNDLLMRIFHQIYVTISSSVALQSNDGRLTYSPLTISIKYSAYMGNGSKKTERYGEKRRRRDFFPKEVVATHTPY